MSGHDSDLSRNGASDYRGAIRSPGVEMKRRGYESKLIATSFGHANETLTDALYGEFAPRTADLIASKRRRACLTRVG